MQRVQESETRLKLQQKELAVTNEELEERNAVLERQKAEIERARRDLTVQADVDLARLAATSGTASGPGYLGFAAQGRLEIQGVVSDGFASAARSAALSGGRSFGLGFESGGDTVLGS